MAEIEENFNAKMETAIIALIEQPTIEDAARVAGVSARSLWRWLARNDFKRRLNEARAMVYENSLNELKSASLVAVRTLVEVAQDKEATASARVSASVAILANGFKAIEQSEFKERLERLEQLLTEKNYEFQTIA